MFENIINFFRKLIKNNKENSKDAAKERLHLVLAQDRANISVDFMEMMKQEIIEVIKKYIEVDEKEIDVRLTSKTSEDGTSGAPSLYANIPIITIKNEARKIQKDSEEEDKEEQGKKVKENNEKDIKNVDKNNDSKEEEIPKQEEKFEEETSTEKSEEKDENNVKEDENKEIKNNKEKEESKSEQKETKLEEKENLSENNNAEEGNNE